MKINPFSSKARYTAVMGILFGLSAALTAFESIFSVFLPVGMRIGLSNIAVLTTAVCINLPSALIITVLKALFAAVTRGFTAGAMSLSGGLLAFAAAALLLKYTKASYVFIGCICALCHTTGQLCTSMLFTGSVYTLYYAPLLLLTAVLSGAFTGTVLGLVVPQAKRIISGKGNFD